MLLCITLKIAWCGSRVKGHPPWPFLFSGRERKMDLHLMVYPTGPGSRRRRAWFHRMQEIHRAMSGEEHTDFSHWEGDIADWPGWQRLGLPQEEDMPMRSSNTIHPAVRWAVWNRDNFTCQGCGTRSHLSIDHKVPRSRGGTDEQTNLQTLCESCNSQKGARI